jgi:hypothetical protein
MNSACYPPSSAAACDTQALANVNRARSIEGLLPMILPTNYGSLNPPEQLFVLTNLERVDRGLPAVAGLSSALDNYALYGAEHNTDPPLPPSQSASSLWMGGYATALYDDFYWMYDDGPGGVSSDCCWAHRDAILRSYPGPTGDLLMGAAVTSTSAYPDSAAAVLAAGETLPTYFTWSNETPYLQYSMHPTVIELGAAPGQSVSAGVVVEPSGESATFIASISGGSGTWTMNNSSCTAAAAHYCSIGLTFRPTSAASELATLTMRGPSGAKYVSLRGGPFSGYWLASSDGGVFSFGTAQFKGSMGGRSLAGPIVSVIATPDHQGYWEVGSDGGVFSFGDAPFAGSLGGARLSRPIVGAAPDPSGKGYWLVGADGGVFNFGTARFYGSKGGQPIPFPIVGMAAVPTGGGYWLVAANGAVYPFGSARNHGSTAGVHLDAPIRAMAPTVDGGGYWLVGSDGGVFNFGDAPFYGSAFGKNATPIIGILRAQTNKGYWEVGTNGSVFSYGSAPFDGSAYNYGLRSPVEGVAG